MFGGLTTFSVDFHNVDDDDRIVLLSNEAEGWQQRRIQRGQTVQLWDDESGYVLAEISRIRGERMWAEVRWPTWSPRPVVEMATDVRPARRTRFSRVDAATAAALST
jgi:16S rRNA U1498 N3-methylase RsmE